mgnify:FL=1
MNAVIKRIAAARLAEIRRQSLERQTDLIWVKEHQFCDSRKWRFDFACPEIAIAIEIDGGVWTRGRHSRGTGQVADMEKINTAQLFGWIVLRYTPQQFDGWAWLEDVRIAKGRCKA